MNIKKIILVMVSIVLLFSLSGCDGSSSSNNTVQYYNIDGFIRTQNFDSPIEGAEIEIAGQSIVTNEDGYYIIEKIRGGRYSWKVSSEGYQGFSAPVYIDDDMTISQKLDIEAGTAVFKGSINIHNSSVKISDMDLKTDKLGKTEANMAADYDFEKTENREDYKRDEIIVKYKSSLSSQSIVDLQQKKGLKKVADLNLRSGNIYRYEIPEDKSVEEMLSYYKELENVEWAESNYYNYLTAVPNDPGYSEQWGNFKVNLEAAWDQNKGSSAVTVAVIDSGIIPNHPDLKANLLQGADFVGGSNSGLIQDYNMTDDDPTDETTLAEGGSHGTHVSGIIGAAANNALGIAGVNWQVDLLPIRSFAARAGSNWDIAEGIYYAVDNGADVINTSFGSLDYSILIHEAIRYAVQNDVVVVSAAGNDSSYGIAYPARYEETIAVSAVALDNSISSYSNYGPRVDITAPGGYYKGVLEDLILSTWGYYENGQTYPGYKYLEGTSMSAPFVSGAAALLIADGVSPSRVKERLTSTARDLGVEGKDNYYGHGLLDVYGALLNKRLENPYVFAAEEKNGDLYVRSEIIIAEADGSFTLNDAAAGELKLIAWRDVNEDGIINGGDYYGENQKTFTVSEGGNYAAEFEIYYLPEQSAAPVSVFGMPEIKSN